MAAVDELITEHIDIWTSAVKRKSSSGRGGGKKVELYGVKKLRELILDLAVRGRLVPQDPEDEPASMLFERIEDEKIKLGKIKKPKKSNHRAKDDKVTNAIHKHWIRKKFSDLYELEYGDNLPKSKRSETGEYPVYGSNGIVGSHKSASVEGPCIVVGRKGSAGALNLSESSGCWITDVAYSITPPSDLSLKFVYLSLHTYGLDALGKGIKPGLSRKEAYEIMVDLPPFAEQHRIVAKVDELMTLCDQLKTRLETAQITKLQLADAVTEQAVT